MRMSLKEIIAAIGTLGTKPDGTMTDGENRANLERFELSCFWIMLGLMAAGVVSTAIINNLAK